MCSITLFEFRKKPFCVEGLMMPLVRRKLSILVAMILLRSLPAHDDKAIGLKFQGELVLGPLYTRRIHAPDQLLGGGCPDSIILLNRVASKARVDGSFHRWW